MKFIELSAGEYKILLNTANILYIKGSDKNTLIRTNVPVKYGANNTNSNTIIVFESYDVVKRLLEQ